MAAGRRILFVSHSSALYGAERVLLNTVEGLSANYDILMLFPRMGPFPELMQKRGVKCLFAPYRAWLWTENHLPRLAYHLLFNLMACTVIPRLKKERIDLVYSNSLASPFGAIVAGALGKPHVWHFHEMVRDDVGRHFDLGLSLSMNICNRYTDEFILCSQALYRHYGRYLQKDRLNVIHNGILEKDGLRDARPKKIAGKKAFTLGIVGSVTPEKRQADALELLGILVGRGLDVRLLIVGGGGEDYLNDLKYLAGQLGITDRVIFTGFLNSTREVYETCDMTLLCTGFESFPLVVIEAMSLGCPVAAPSVGGIPEIITSGVDGMLHGFGDIGRMADNVQGLLSDSDMYARMSAAAINGVYGRFSKDVFVSGITGVIERVLSIGTGKETIDGRQ